MSTAPTSRSRYQQLKERRRKMKRRQLARLLAVLLLIVVAVGALFAAIALLRGCGSTPQSVAEAGQEPAASSAFVPDPAADSGPLQLVYARSFRQAPWFVAVDNSRLYACEPGGPPDADGAYPITRLLAQPLQRRQRGWTVDLGASFHQLGIAAGAVVALEQTVDGSMLHGLDAGSGTGVWTAPAENDDAELAMDGRTAILALSATDKVGQPSAYRLAGYDPAKGGKRWGIRPPFGGLKGAEHAACCGPSPRLRLSSWEGICAYQLHNVVGVVDTADGKVLRSYDSAFHVSLIQVDREGEAFYLVTHAESPGSYRLIRVPFSGSPRRLLEFQSPSEDMLLLAHGKHVLLAYELPIESPTPLTRLIAVERGSSAPELDVELEGYGCDLAAIPGLAGEFLLALSTERDDWQLPRGRGTLHRVNLAERSTEEVQRLGQATLMLAPFKSDLLVLQRGGQIQRFMADSNRLRRVRKARHELSEAVYSSDHNTLLVTSYPQSYLESHPGAPMQVLVFQ